MQFKLIEAWYVIKFNQSWNHFRIKVFEIINSLLAYVLMVRGPQALKPLVKHLQEVARPGQRKELQDAVESLASGDIDLLFRFLRNVVTPNGITDYIEFYPRAFVFLIQFLAVDEDREVIHETAINDLFTDLNTCHDPTKLSAMERKAHVRILSLVSSIILTEYEPCGVADERRRKYAEAAYFLGTRIHFLLLSNCKEASVGFWEDDKYVPGYNLLDYCEEESMLRVKKDAHKYNLPRVQSEDQVQPVVDDLLDFENMETAAAIKDKGDEAKDRTMKRTSLDSPDGEQMLIPLSIRGWKVEKLKSILAVKGLSCEGKKKELQQRLVETGDFTLQAPKKKPKAAGTVDDSCDEDDD